MQDVWVALVVVIREMYVQLLMYRQLTGTVSLVMEVFDY